MIYTENGEYHNTIELSLGEGYLNIIFGNESEIVKEFEIDIENKRNVETIDIYIRNKSEGFGSEINHAITVKASAHNSKNKELIPYSVPKTKDGTCEKTVKGYDDFDRKYGNLIKTFVNNTAPLIVEYWEADPDDMKMIEQK